MIICIGNAVVDLIFETNTAIEENKKNQAQNFQIAVGGNGANVASVLSYYGNKVSFLGQIGSDIFGSKIKEELKSLGITVLEQADPPLQTSVSVVINDTRKATRTILNYKENHLFSSINSTEQPQWIYSDGRFPEYTTQLRKKYMDTPILWDWERREHYRNNHAIVAKNDILICSEDFITYMISDHQSEQEIINFLYDTSNFSIIIITKGSNGVYWSTFEKQDLTHVPADTVKAIDTNGAGDVFHAIFLHYLQKKLPVEEIISKAVDVSSAFVTKKGFLTALPKLS
ncbi:MAG: carbohydrate kinase family protein [Treponemataceae bacterium]